MINPEEAGVINQAPTSLFVILSTLKNSVNPVFLLLFFSLFFFLLFFRLFRVFRGSHSPLLFPSVFSVVYFSLVRLSIVAEWAWQTAMARASAASSGLGVLSSDSSCVIIYCTCFLSAAP